jgi:hypothetical protein
MNADLAFDSQPDDGNTLADQSGVIPWAGYPEAAAAH